MKNTMKNAKNTSLLASVKNQTRFICNSSGGGIASTMDASYYKGCGLRQGVEREFVVLEVSDERTQSL